MIGVVDDDADGEAEREEREGVQREAGEVDERDRPEERHRDREDDVQRRGERAEEHPADERRQDDREEELELDLVDRVLDEGRRVEVDPDLHPGREGLLDLGHRGLDALGDGDGVRAALLADAEPLGGGAVDAGDAPLVLEAVLDEGDVLEVDRRAVQVAERDLAERRSGRGPRP